MKNKVFVFREVLNLEGEVTLNTHDNIMTLNELFHILIEEDIYLIFHYEDRISESIIADAFKKVNKDKQKPKILSLKQK